LTATATGPAFPAGLVTVHEVAEQDAVSVAAAAPNVTDPPVRFVPVTVTEVPPVVGPDVGAIDVTVGSAA
jgi:hypothetical protein